mmetsp:Transcript_2014/g.3777  ORF Transcript_2014/g.3777 Transcript_2014/m.3777 type:complete len:148 (+) Transcript_2014:551-994(+)
MNEFHLLTGTVRNPMNQNNALLIFPRRLRPDKHSVTPLVRWSRFRLLLDLLKIGPKAVVLTLAERRHLKIARKFRGMAQIGSVVAIMTMSMVCPYPWTITNGIELLMTLWQNIMIQDLLEVASMVQLFPLVLRNFPFLVKVINVVKT